MRALEASQFLFCVEFLYESISQSDGYTKSLSREKRQRGVELNMCKNSKREYSNW